ncbi:MAG: hypothetical protein CYPHOPRED_004036 [Cyphobasidiales sp. Tagirdzhanova-0007]|nr:MAG: hypothetical protein CYPHOPRED_004036 [Cyphobasidiales sp. Tagirdzhanova-0007]
MSIETGTGYEGPVPTLVRDDINCTEGLILFILALADSICPASLPFVALPVYGISGQRYAHPTLACSALSSAALAVRIVEEPPAPAEERDSPKGDGIETASGGAV